MLALHLAGVLRMLAGLLTCARLLACAWLLARARLPGWMLRRRWQVRRDGRLLGLAHDAERSRVA
ncbi:hypothetical protein D7252_03610 [Microbacterium sp. CGR2]|nr:hypothetical protein D7252_03610 [Microbacterium sp. CGR2]